MPMTGRLLPFLPLFFFAACVTVKDPDLRGIENIRIGHLNLKESNLSLDLHYFNPNKYRLVLKQAEGDCWLNGNLAGHFKIDTLVYIPGNSDFRLPVKLKIDMTHIVDNISVALLDRVVILKVEGTARVGKGFVFINYPIHYEGKQDLGALLR